MIGKRPFRAVVLGLAATAFGWLLDRSGLALPLAIAGGVLIAFVALVMPWLGLRWLDDAIDAVRAWIWRGQHGRHHAFNGVLLDVHDDGRHVWIGAEGVCRVLHWRDGAAHLAARLPGRTRRGDDGEPQLRVDALADYLHSGNSGRDPARLRLLRYLERELLFPAAERRRRSETMT